MNRRYVLIVLAALCAKGRQLAAIAQDPQKVWRVAFFSTGSRGMGRAGERAFLAGMSW